MSFDPDAWNKTTATGGMEPPSPGIYEVEVLTAGTFYAKDGRPFSKVTYRVLTGPQIGVCWEQIGGLEGKAAGFTKANLSILGYDAKQVVESLEHLGELLEAQLTGTEATVKVAVSDGGYTNTDVISARTATPDIPTPSNGNSSADASAPVVDEDGDVIPF